MQNKISFIIWLVQMLVLVFQGVTSLEIPVVSVEQGVLRGKVGTSRSGRQFYEFLGVPYGKIPVRFGLSQMADKWRGVKDATKSGPSCLQYNILLRRLMGEEDCLFLNVYTPNLSHLKRQSEKLLPVMLYIHGGGFFQGFAGEFGGKYLMGHDVVYVAINYRVGPLGFLNAGIEGASGNQGLKDQVLALQWVNKNIGHFGGDAKQVTIFGQSAGGGSVSLLTLSPMAKGLFQSAISQSGTALCPFVTRTEPSLGEAKLLATLLNCPTEDGRLMVECLRGVRAEDIVRSTIPKHPGHPYFDTSRVPQFAPSVEPFQEDPSTVFLPDSPLKLLQQGDFNRVPWIVGVNEQEGILLAAPVLSNSSTRGMINRDWGHIAPSAFLYQKANGDLGKVTSSVRTFYFGEYTPISQENRQALADLNSDRYFTECTREAAMLYAKHAPVFLYNFTHKVRFSVGIFLGWKYSSRHNTLVFAALKPPTHMDEVQYFFDFIAIPYSPGIYKGHPDQNFSDKLIQLWISFARNGKPTDWGSGKVNWPPLNETTGSIQWMNIGQNGLRLEPENPQLSKRLDFWTGINSYLRSEGSDEVPN